MSFHRKNKNNKIETKLSRRFPADFEYIKERMNLLRCSINLKTAVKNLENLATIWNKR